MTQTQSARADAHALDDRAAETADPLLGCPVDQAYVDIGLDRLDRGRRVVVAVVDEDDLYALMWHGEARSHTLDSLNELADVALLVPGRNDDRKPWRLALGFTVTGGQRGAGLAKTGRDILVRILAHFPEVTL